MKHNTISSFYQSFDQVKSNWLRFAIGIPLFVTASYGACTSTEWQAGEVKEMLFPSATAYNNWGAPSSKNIQFSEHIAPKLGTSYYSHLFYSTIPSDCKWSAQSASIYETNQSTGQLALKSVPLFTHFQDSNKVYLGSNTYTSFAGFSKLLRWVNQASDTLNYGAVIQNSSVSFNGPVMGVKIGADSLVIWYASLYISSTNNTSTTFNTVSFVTERDSATAVSQIQNALNNTQLPASYSTYPRLYRIAYSAQSHTTPLIQSPSNLQISNIIVVGKQLYIENPTQELKFTIYDVQGSTLQKGIIPQGQNRVSLSSNLTSGHYLLEWKNQNSSRTGQFQIK